MKIHLRDGVTLRGSEVAVLTSFAASLALCGVGIYEAGQQMKPHSSDCPPSHQPVLAERPTASNVKGLVVPPYIIK